MVLLYRCDRNTSDELRAKQINEKREQLASMLIASSQIDPLMIAIVTITVRKIRNRSTTDTQDRYIIRGDINV